jgi:hypothetical protein
VRYLNYYLTMIRHSKELAEAFGYRTHNWKILGSNSAALIISF